MQLCFEDVRKVFQDLIDHRISREAADRWAYSAIQASENRELVFVPPRDQDQIWGGVMNLIGIDIQESPGQYLFSEEDIRDAMLKTLGER